mgnify:CR=1 FL=1
MTIEASTEGIPFGSPDKVYIERVNELTPKLVRDRTAGWAAFEKIKLQWEIQKMNAQAEYAKQLTNATNRLTFATLVLAVATIGLVIET